MQVDKLQPALNDLHLGDLDKQSCQGLAKTATLCHQSTIDYFSLEAPQIADGGALQAFLSAFVFNTIVDNNFNIIALRAAKTGRRLHHQLIVDQPDSTTLNEFFQCLSEYQVDPATSALQKLPKQKEQVNLIKIKYENAISIDSPTFLERIILLSTDVESISESL